MASIGARVMELMHKRKIYCDKSDPSKSCKLNLNGELLQVSRLLVQHVSLVHTHTDYCLPTFYTWVPTTRCAQSHPNAALCTTSRSRLRGGQLERGRTIS
jgi:hypothetical protein